MSPAWNILSAPFRVLWSALTSIANLSGAQVRSLVTVAFLGGMMSLSGENWALTFAADNASHRFIAEPEGSAALFGFLLERMRYISGLQFWLALILGAVVLGADYVRLKLGEHEASIGKGAEQ